MEWFDAHTLARMQFAFTVSFHIVFPAFSIGLASYLAVLNGLHLMTGRAVYLDLFNYWKKIFAVAFGMGVVSGLVMSYEFGTNWSVFSDKVGPVLGPLPPGAYGLGRLPYDSFCRRRSCCFSFIEDAFTKGCACDARASGVAVSRAHDVFDGDVDGRLCCPVANVGR